ncbi:MAG TPA: helix-turn-helix domain-containing protein, partial [Negativicutes bacterium]|nr:helix-turn-helix domain-containing protein [Negativicutes bacterium]
LERAVIMSSGVIGAQDLPGLALDSIPPRVVIPEAGTLRDIMHQIEKQIIARTLKACGGNRGKTAQVLDISRRALQYKIDEHSLGKAVLESDQAAE